MRHCILLALTMASSACTTDLDVESELNVETAESELSTRYVECYVDTPALDVYQKDRCSANGNVGSTVSFRFYSSVPPTYVQWRIIDPLGNPVPSNCIGSQCDAAISPGQTIRGVVDYYIINGTPTQGALATAVYRSLQ